MEELFDALLSKGKSNANKSFPVLRPGEIPPIQKEHMATSTEEKREIKRRAEAEEARRIEAERLAKLEAERLERERIERERLAAVLDQKRLAKQQEIKVAQMEYNRACAEYSGSIWGAGNQPHNLFMAMMAASNKLDKLKKELEQLR
jgi:regulator of protease activity HflC (stomatin/prohibitin superfamily)